MIYIINMKKYREVIKKHFEDIKNDVGIDDNAKQEINKF